MLVVSGAMLLALAACKRDLGNYDYNDINVLSIYTDTVNANRLMVINNDSVVIKQGDTLTVKALLNQTIESDDVSFSWMVTQRGTGGNPSQYVLGNTQLLNARILVSPGVYNLVCKATDNKTGVSYYKTYALNVITSPWGDEGWLVLQEDPNKDCDLSVITTRDGVKRGEIYNNVYSLANGHKLPWGTNKVNVLNYVYSTVGAQKVSFFYPGGGTQVRGTDFTDSSTIVNWFSVSPNPNLQVNKVTTGGAYEFLINDGLLYYRILSIANLKTPPILFSPPILGTWSLAPFILDATQSGGYVITLYDQKYKSFLAYSFNPVGLLYNTTDLPNKHMPAFAGKTDSLPNLSSGFDMNYIGRDLLFADNVTFLGTTSPTTWDCFFRNSTKDSSFVYQVGAFGAGAAKNDASTGKFYLDPAKVPGINTASMFAVPTHVTNKDKFYYVGNTGGNDSIYTCSLLNGVRSSATANSLGFPAGTVIKVMKVFKAGYVIPSVVATNPATESKVLVVATDETASGNGNKVYFFNLDATTGAISTSPSQVYTGFNKIVDLTFKKALLQ
ncbi:MULTISPECIES: PKD-like family lipoprotein [Niastella]|uniref:PKD-like family protein n=1 Tax=Niastella soli TaxID=2821487 RepID=A0ABS3Z4N7_9BACT|nr:PKD-like family lipoprotein [Niastella soli]MBO9204702.1 hypothetical protein [Niastella soli]